MDLYFALGWAREAALRPRDFKSAAARELFDDYCRRLNPFSPCRAGKWPAGRPEGAVWLCDRARPRQAASSEQLAERLARERDSGRRMLTVVIGGPDGVEDKTAAELKPDFVWSFGPLTLPHELAAVVAAEQLYRAWTILNQHPYHLGH